MKSRINIITPAKYTFVVRDVKLLSDTYRVNITLLPEKIGLGEISGLCKLIWGMIRANLVISWFADASYYPTLICKMFRKKIIVIVAGYDVADVPSIDYGALINQRIKKRVEWVLKNATKILVVDQGLIDDIKLHFDDDFGAQILPTGYDSSKYRPLGDKEKMVLSVCNAKGKSGLIKGIDVFVKCAERMPEIPFVLIGTKSSALPFLGTIPDNLKIIDHLPPEDIIPYYQRAKVYCQLSMREGLPNAVCEAMLCDCIVVGSDVQGIRTIVSDLGFLVPYGDIDAILSAINKAFSVADSKGREFVMEKYSENTRKERLFSVISALIDG